MAIDHELSTVRLLLILGVAVGSHLVALLGSLAEPTRPALPDRL